MLFLSQSIRLATPFSPLLFATSFILPLCSATHSHNGSFTPSAVLRITAQNISIGGIHGVMTLVNGSTPGPVLRIHEKKVAWIRVYNDMKEQNLTMVCWRADTLHGIVAYTKYRLALAWPFASRSALLRRNTTRQ